MGLSREHQELVRQGSDLFAKRMPFMHLCQELAENFYPERADFTRAFDLGEEFASNLDTSYPIIARRDLADSFGAMLRRPGTNWFHVGVKRDRGLDEAGRQWLSMAERVQYRALYDIDSQFVKSTKEGDNDFATFGQCVLSSEPVIHPRNGFILLHRCWHIRDVVWCDDAFGKVGHVQRKWEPTAQELVEIFGKAKLHREVVDCVEKPNGDPYKTFEIRHIRIATSQYDSKFKTPYVSIYIDVKNEHLIEEVGIWTPYYVIPRWKTVSGSQYAYSPSAIAALPDARLLQAMTYTLLTAGEFAVEPALVGYPEAIKGAIESFPGGFTALDATYDERLGEAIRPLMKGGERAIPLGLKMNQDTRVMIADAFYLTKLGLPDAGLGGMSPFEVAQRIEEFIRATLPLFEPMETEYNGALMEQDFEILLRAGAFGPVDQIPPSLSNQETEFRFESPMRESIDRLKGHQFMEAQQMVVAASQTDPSAVFQVNWPVALRDALHGIGITPEWLPEMDQVMAQAEAMQQKAALVEAGAMMQGGAAVAQQMGDAMQSVKTAVGGEEKTSQPAKKPDAKKQPDKKAA